MSIFDKLPDRIFAPLAAPNRRFYAALLIHLYGHTFGAIGDTPRKRDVLNEIGDFIERYEGEFGRIQDDQESLLSPAHHRAIAREAKQYGQEQDLRRYFTFRYLSETGWLLELRDRFRRLVDLSPEGRMLLHEIQRIARGDTRSYGGAVLNVLGSLDTAAAHPDERSEAIHNAWSFARDFTQHLRTVAGTMRRVEERILGHKELRHLFRAFFEDFVTEYLISDYKTLQTTNNPFRFRHKIIERAREIEADALLMGRLAAAYVREGRAQDRDAAIGRLRSELDDVYRVFDNIDRQLLVITDTQGRIERRIHTIVRYMDRHDGGIIERLTEAISRVAGLARDLSDEIDVQHRMVTYDPPIGGADLYVPRPAKQPIERTRVKKVEMDPALERYDAEKRLFAELVTVTPTKMKLFAEEALQDRQRIKGSEIAVLTVEDFVVFQRLREISLMFDGYLGKDYRITPLKERVENEWLTFYDFILERAPRTEEVDDVA